MIVSPYAMSSVVRVAPNQRYVSPTGIGRVIVDKNDVYLQSSGERIPLDAQIKSSVTNGMLVNYQIEDDVIYLSPVVFTSQQNSKTGDSIAITGNPPTSEEVVPRYSLPVPATIADGYYKFSNLKDALHFFAIDEQSDLARLIRDTLNQDGAIIIKIDRTLPQQNSVILLSPADLEQSIAAVQGQLKSDVLRKIPLDSFLSVVMSAGMLSVDFIKSLDVTLEQQHPQLPAIRAGSPDVQTRMLDHWFRSIINSSLSLDSCAKLLPTVDAQKMVDLMDASTSIKNTCQMQLSLDKTPLFIDESSIQKNAQTFLPQTFERLGFLLERNFATATTDSPPPRQSLNSLKSLLLSLQNEIEKEQITQPTVKQNLQSVPALPSTTKGSVVSSQSFETDDNQKIIDTLINVRTILSNLKSAFFPELSVQHPLPVAASTQTSISKPTELTSDINFQKSLDKSLQQISELLFSSKYPHGISSDRLPKIAPHLSDTQLKLQPVLLNQFMQLVNKIDTVIVNETTASLQPLVLSGQSPIPLLLPILSNVFTAIDTLFTQLHRANAEQHPQDISTVQKDSVPMQQMQLTGSTLVSPSSPLSSVIDTLESLQFLARQVPANEGMEQIIALPIKFGEQTTEINIRLLNYKQKQTSKSSTMHYSIYMDVAPPSLGAIHSHLDYYRSKNLQIHIQCSKKKTVRWFEQQQQHLQKILQPIFRHPVTIAVSLHRPKQLPSQQRAVSSTIIDMKI